MIEALYLEVLPKLTAAEAGGFDLPATRKRGFAIAMVLENSAHSPFRTFRQSQWHELVRLLESRPLMVGYNCRNFDLEILRSLGEVRPQKLCDLMWEFAARKGQLVNIRTALREFTGAIRQRSSADAFHSLRLGDERKCLAELKRHLSDMRRLHLHMVRHGWLPRTA